MGVTSLGLAMLACTLLLSFPVQQAQANCVTTSPITVNSVPTGFFVALSPADVNGKSSGFAHVTFIVCNGDPYTVTATPGFGSFHFDHWQDTCSTNNARTVTASTSLTLTAVYSNTNNPLQCVGLVGGKILPIDMTALFLAGAMTNAFWMVPTLGGIAGAAMVLFKIKRKRE